MITFLTVILTLVMVLDCLLLMLLVLIQLPRKEAGAGLAFGGGAADALLGVGSGNVLTTVTKWAAGLFFGLAIVLSMLNSHVRNSKTDEFQKLLQATPAAAPMTPAATPTAPAGSNAAPLMLTTPGTNAPAAATPTTPVAPAKPAAPASNAPAAGGAK